MVIGAIIGILLASIFNMIVIFIVGKLKLGIEVDNLGTAFLAALIIGVLGYFLKMITDPMVAEAAFPQWAVYLIHLVISAIVILIAGRILKGMVTRGFSGALLAAVVIALLYWLINYILQQLA